MADSRHLNVNDWYQHQEKPPRSEWTGCGLPRVGYTGGEWNLKSSKDYSICPDCGGTGWRWVKNKNKQRLMKCNCDATQKGNKQGGNKRQHCGNDKGRKGQKAGNCCGNENGGKKSKEE